jgi:hypothetical protein
MFFAFVERLFKKKPRKISTDDVKDDDPYRRYMVAATMNHGYVTGNVDDDGILHVINKEGKEIETYDPREYPINDSSSVQDL